MAYSSVKVPLFPSIAHDHKAGNVTWAEGTQVYISDSTCMVIVADGIPADDA